jgi:hypothetical protein
MSAPLFNVSSLANIFASERRDKRKPFRKVFSFKDENWVNVTTVTIASGPVGLTGPVSMLFSRYKNFVNYVSGLVIIQTTRPNAVGKREGEKAFECIAILSLDAFLSAFTEADVFADTLESKIHEVSRELQFVI